MQKNQSYLWKKFLKYEDIFCFAFAFLSAEKLCMKTLFGWIILNYHIAIFLCQIFSVYSAAKSSSALSKFLWKQTKSQLLCKNFQSKSEFSTSKVTIKAHGGNRKSLVSYACPEHCKPLKKCGVPGSSQALEKDQLQWYVTSNIHLFHFFESVQVINISHTIEQIPLAEINNPCFIIGLNPLKLVNFACCSKRKCALLHHSYLV